MAAPDLSQFTHTFEVAWGSDGSQFLIGQVEFNLDKKASFYISNSSVPLSKDALNHFHNLLDFLLGRFVEFDGIKKIEIVQKPLP